MKIKFKENKILTKDNFQDILQKALKNLDDYEFSNFEFEKEWQLAYIKYIEEIIDSIVEGLSLNLKVDPSLINKSFQIPTMTLLKTSNEDISEESLFYKSLWQKLKEKYSKSINYFKKFNFNKSKPLKPMKIDEEIIYNPETKKDLTNKEWTSIENSVVDFLKDTLDNPDEEIAIRAGLFGLLKKKMDEEGISKSKQKKKTYDDLLKEYPEVNDTKKVYKQISKKKNMKAAVKYAQKHAAEYLAIKDGDLKKDIVSMIRKQVVGGLEDGISAQEMVSRIYHIDPKDELGKRFTENTTSALNRDLRRIVLTEMSTASNNGYLAANKDDAEKGEKLYFVFSGQHNPKEKPNKPCNSYLGKIGLMVDKPQSDDSTDDPNADYLIWPGKTNVGRTSKDWWFAIPVHPHCTHYWERIHPEFQQYNEDINKIEYKDIEKSKDDSLDNAEWKTSKAQPLIKQFPKFIKKIKSELKIDFPIIVRLYKKHKEGKSVRSLHDEGIILMYEATPDWRGDLCHEVGHLYYHLMKVSDNKKIINELNKIKNKLKKSKKFNRVFNNEHTYSDIKEIFATIFKWHVSGKIIDKAYSEVLKEFLPGKLDFLNNIFSSNLKKTKRNYFDLIKNDKTKLKMKFEEIPINIEWLKGEIRSYPGSPWKNPMNKHHYGYIRNTDSPDGEDVDVYVHMPIKKGAPIYMLNQLHSANEFQGEFDEHKFMIGYPSAMAAKSAYIETMQKNMFGGMVKISIKNFKKNILPFYYKK